ncbi:C2 domain-containing protein [Aureococcus anophagefferens]|nr:C2 domain-containing protein [Aureococcus anophagefferens]
MPSSPGRWSPAKFETIPNSPKTPSRAERAPSPTNEPENTFIAYDSADASFARFAASPFAGRAGQRRLRVGRVSVDVIAAAELAVADSFSGSSDPYAVLEITGYGLSKRRREWPDDVRESYATKIVKKDLNPTWDERCVFESWRYGAVLRVVVYDHDDDSADDLLGAFEVPLDGLANKPAAAQWYTFADGAPGGVKLKIKYDVDAVGEAASVLWLDPKPSKVVPRFHANAFYNHAMDIGAARPRARERRLRRRRLEGPEDRAMDAKEKALAALFAQIDEDGSGSIDADELAKALAVCAARKGQPPPTEKEVAKLFKKHATGNPKGVHMAEFRELEKHLGEAALEAASPPGFSSLGKLVKAPSVKKRQKKKKKEKEPEIKGPLKGMLLRTFNSAANGAAGKQLGKAQLECAGVARDVNFAKGVLLWKDAMMTGPLLAANVAFAAAHYVLPPNRVVPLYVCGAFFGLTETCDALQVVAERAPRALGRYVALRRGLAAGARKTGRPSTAFSKLLARTGSKASGAMAEALERTVRAIFKRVDVDGSESLSKAELRAFVEAAAADSGADAARALADLDAAVAKVDLCDGEVDVAAFTTIVLDSNIAELLLASELRAQVLSPEGVECVKRPSAGSSTISLSLSSHACAVAVRGDCFAYAKRSGHWAEFPLGGRAHRAGREGAARDGRRLRRQGPRLQPRERLRRRDARRRAQRRATPPGVVARVVAEPKETPKKPPKSSSSVDIFCGAMDASQASSSSGSVRSSPQATRGGSLRL